MRIVGLGLVPAVVMAAAGIVHAEQDYFPTRDKVAPATTYLESDGGVLAEEPSDSPWETFVEADEAPSTDRFALPGPFAIRQTSPELQTLVFGPSVRNQESRIEVGAGLAYVNSRGRHPFEISVEPTWRRNKNADSGDRHFSRVRTFGLLGLWDRSSDWESTAIAATAFYDTQSDSFDALEFGGAISQTFGQRLTISGNLLWGGEWPDGSSFNNAMFGSLGTSYNLGAGLRTGGFYELDNNYTHEDDWGGFLAYQFLPFAEFVVNAGKNEFVLVRVLFSYALERP